mgnify:CR=1 FL=1
MSKKPKMKHNNNYESEIALLPSSTEIKKQIHDTRVTKSKQYIIDRIKYCIENGINKCDIKPENIYNHEEVIEFMVNICRTKDYTFENIKHTNTYYRITLYTP